MITTVPILSHSKCLNYQYLVNKLAGLPKNNNNMARVIFVILANKYGTTTYLTFSQIMVASYKPLWLPVTLDNQRVAFSSFKK